eukprot:TRINITY_DN71502_c0_g1_i1.p1 TRINITY_DN71502_c0_g1~~TRINITY_DN71502_c0_g1_i1.p1  ORF type:complete len:192 (-),score=30.41 TRINITY_DN71502_c0_g1_i1:31-606(-)
MWRQLLESYRAANISRPFLTKALTTGALFGASDCTSQLCLSAAPGYDYERTLRLSLAGSILTAPIFTVYNMWIDRRLPVPLGSAVSPFNVWAPKLVFETVFVAPVYICALVAYNRALDSSGAVRADGIGGEALRLYLDGLKVCPWYQAINFAVVPLHYRVQWQQGCAFFWNMYISYFLQEAKTNPAASDTA